MTTPAITLFEGTADLAPSPDQTVVVCLTVDRAHELWASAATAMREATDALESLVRRALSENSGIEVRRTQGSAMMAFPSSFTALRFCLNVSRTIKVVEWPEELPSFAVKMGVDWGSVSFRSRSDGSIRDAAGPAVRRALRMAAAANPGQIITSFAVEDDVGARDAKDLDAEIVPVGRHRLSGRGDEEELFQVRVIGDDTEHESLESFRSRTNLDPDEPELFGRHRELADLADLASAGHRLIGVIGPTGVGKSTFARFFAAGQVRAGADVWYVDVAHCNTAAEVVEAVWAVIPVCAESSGSLDESVAALGDAIGRGQQVWVCLDGLNLSDDDCSSTVGAWMELAPNARFLVAARRATGLSGEATLRLAPVDMDAAAALFEAKARRTDQRFMLADQDRPKVQALVEKLAANGLLVDLVAGSVGERSAAEVSDQVSRDIDEVGVDLESEEGVSALVAHWFERLPASARDALRECAVFSGGFTSEAAAGTLSVRPGLGRSSMGAALDGLVERGYLAIDENALVDGEVRYQIPRAIAEAVGRSKPPTDSAGLEARHTAYFVETAETWAARVRGPERSVALARLTAERQNLLEVGRRNLEINPAISARAILALASLFTARGPRMSALTALDQVAEALEDGDEVALETRILVARGDARRRVGALRASEDDLRRALEKANANQDRRALGAAYLHLTLTRAMAQRPDQTQQELTRALELCRIAGDRRSEGLALRLLGTMAARRGNRERATELFLEALSLHDRVGDLEQGTLAMMDLSEILHDDGDLTSAREHYERAMALAKSLGERSLQGDIHCRLSGVSVDEGRQSEAEERLAVAETMLEIIGDDARLSHVHRCRGVLFLELDRNQDAEQELETAVELAHSTGSDQAEAAARALLGIAVARRGESDRAEEQLAWARRLPVGDDGSRQLALLDAAEGVICAATARRGSLDTEASRKNELIARAERQHRAIGAEGANFRRVGSDVRRALRWLERELGPSSHRIGGVSSEAMVSEAMAGEGLRVSSEGRWFQAPAGKRVSLDRRRSMRRILRALVERRVSDPGEPLTVDDLIRAGWPGENLPAKVGAARLYVAVGNLRKLGLSDALTKRTDGYLLHPAVPVVRVPD